MKIFLKTIATQLAIRQARILAQNQENLREIGPQGCVAPHSSMK